MSSSSPLHIHIDDALLQLRPVTLSIYSLALSAAAGVLAGLLNASSAASLPLAPPGPGVAHHSKKITMHNKVMLDNGPSELLRCEAHRKIKQVHQIIMLRLLHLRPGY